MAAGSSINEALTRMENALLHLEHAVSARLEMQDNLDECEAEVQRMNADRARLAQELDHSEVKVERLEQANKDVSRRLVNVMETVRAVIER